MLNRQATQATIRHTLTDFAGKTDAESIEGRTRDLLILTKCIYNHVMNVEWDENKNHINIRKHGIDFADVHGVFDDPMIVQVDDRDYDEVCWKGTGYLTNFVVVVIYVKLDGDTVRLISARKALTHERRHFEQELKNRLG